MQTTHPNDDMYADFFQVGGYRNFGSIPANTMSGSVIGVTIGKSLSDLAQRGRSDTSFIGMALQQFTRKYDEIKKDFNLSDSEIDKLWEEHKGQGGKLKNFRDYVDAVEYSNSKLEEQIIKEQIINSQKTLPTVDEIDISDVDFEEKKSGVPLMYVGVGAVVLVGITILIVKKF